MEKSLCSIFSMLGRISLTVNSSAVCPINCCCSVKSSGVKTSSGRRDSRRKLPPEILDLEIAAVVAITHPFKCKYRHGRGGAATLRTSNCKRESPQKLVAPYLSLRLREVLENPRRAHSATHTHGHHAIASVAAFEFANDRGRKLGPSAA